MVKTTTKVGATKSAKNGKPAKAAAAERGPSKQSQELQAEIRKFMKKGKEYTSREIVEGLGREPGTQGGGPVIRELKRMEESKEVKYGSNEAYKTGFVWVRIK